MLEARFAPPPGQGRAGRERLEAARCATGAARAVRSQANMADMRRHAAAAVQQPTIDHHAAPDAGAHGHEDEVAQVTPRAELPLAIGRCDAVILDHDRKAELLAKNVAQGKTLPSAEAPSAW